MDRVYSDLFLKRPIQNESKTKNHRLKFFTDFAKSVACTFQVLLKGGVGVGFHWYIARKAFFAYFKSKIDFNELRNFGIAPLDSFRYFEFHFGYVFIEELGFKTYMDVSSPRFFPAYVIEKKNISKPFLINPDKNDITLTKEIFEKLSLGNHPEYINKLIDEVNFQPKSFDLISSISVLEHIPSEHIENAIQQLLKLVKPGGHLLISVPVAKRGFEEYINWNEYGLQNEENNGEKPGYYFGQRFHDKAMIDKLFFALLGNPVKMKIVGEDIKGFFNTDRFNKLNSIDYEGWRESINFHNNYSIYPDIDSLPGIGVAIFLFQIPVNA